MLQWRWKNNEQSTNILENIDILLLSQKSQISKINVAKEIDILITRNFNVCILVNAQHSCAHSPYVAISRAPDPWGYGKLLNVKHGKLLKVSLILIGILGGGNSTRLLIGHAVQHLCLGLRAYVKFYSPLSMSARSSIFSTASRVWVSPLPLPTPLKLHSYKNKSIIHRSLPPTKIWGEKHKATTKVTLKNHQQFFLKKKTFGKERKENSTYESDVRYFLRDILYFPKGYTKMNNFW